MDGGDSARRADGRRLWWFMVAALPAFLVGAFAPQVLNDGDTLWHVAAGRWMLGHGQVPLTDPFSFTFAGKPWHVHEWLAEVLYAVSWQGFGWAGVAALAGLAVAATAGQLHLFVRQRVSAMAAAVAVLLAFACLAPGMLARPHLLALPLLVCWTGVLIEARAREQAPRLGWVLVMPLWANLHGTALFGTALAGWFAAEALVARPAAWRRTFAQWTPFVAGAAASLLLTPRGIEGVVFLVRLTRMESLQTVGEWQPLDLTSIGAAHVLVLAGVGSLAWWRVRMPWTRAALLVLLLGMTLAHQRHQMLLATVGTMVWAEALGRARAPAGETAGSGFGRAAAAALAAVVALRLAIPTSTHESATNPVVAIAHVPDDLRGRPVINGYNSGGALIGAGIRPFIDGRTDLYGDEFNALAFGAEHGVPGQLQRVLQEWRIAWTFLPAGSPAVAELDRTAGWRRVYADGLIVMHRREATTPH